MLIQNVEFMNDFYVTAIGSTLAPDPTIDPFGFTPSVSLNPSPTAPIKSGTGTSTVTGSPSQSSSSTTQIPSHGGLSHGAIDGIAAGAAILGVFLCAIIVVFCCIRARRRKRITAASNPPPYFPPPMQQQAQPSPPPKAFDGYQSVAPQEQQHIEYPGPHQQAQSFSPPPASAVSPQSIYVNDPRFSTANASLLSPRPSEREPKQSYNKAPLSPAISEVDGTTGNPGVPNEVAHGVPTEVDGTTGNPGIPAGGHGIEHQLVPGGSPSATEIEGRMSDGVPQAQAPLRRHVGQGSIGALMHQPFSDGPYEMGHERR